MSSLSPVYAYKTTDFGSNVMHIRRTHYNPCNLTMDLSKEVVYAKYHSSYNYSTSPSDDPSLEIFSCLAFGHFKSFLIHYIFSVDAGLKNRDATGFTRLLSS